MTGEPKGDYGVARDIFTNNLKWYRERARTRNYREGFHQTAITSEPVYAVSAAFGLIPVVPEVSAEIRAACDLAEELDGQVGKVALIRSNGWRDDTQPQERLFSPAPNDMGDVVDFSIVVASRKKDGWRGWDTYLRLSGISPVYDCWLEDTDVMHTSIETQLYRTGRYVTSKALSTEILHPVQDIVLVTDPDEIQAYVDREDGGEELMEMMKEYLANPVKVAEAE
jgi:hypothetical protein